MFTSSLFLVSQIHSEFLVIVFDWAEYYLYFALHRVKRCRIFILLSINL